tara:strand:- start:210 stop:689 length:480 start_codon:yes stop_codon:yes gene_type:complete
MNVEVAKILSPRGLNGSINVAVYSDRSDRFEVGNKVMLQGVEHRIVFAEIKGSHGIIRLSGVTSSDDVDRLKDSLIYIDEKDLNELPEGEYYYFHIIGSTVIDCMGRNYGTVQEILTTGANDVYVIHNGDKELLIPAVKSVVQKIDIATKTITITPRQD